jgi:peptidyl-tRNA hydrolase
MTTLSDTAMRYRIILRGECGMLLTGIVDKLAVECSPGRTCVVVTVRDESELYGLLDRLQELALHIVCIHELGADRLCPGTTAGG